MHEVSMPPDDPKQPRELNPYEHVVSILASTLAAFDDDQLIPAYGFGDVSNTQPTSEGPQGYGTLAIFD
jgi:E3 ubiquitin-protein ligase RGLG